MKQSNLLLAVWLALPSAAVSAKSVERIALLPFLPEGEGTDTGWDISSELFSRWNGGASMVQVDWESLTRMLDGEEPIAEQLRDPAFMRRIGRFMSVDTVVSGTYTESGDQAMVKAKQVSVETGEVVETVKPLARAVAIPRNPKLDALQYAVLVDGPEEKVFQPRQKRMIAQKAAPKPAAAPAPETKFEFGESFAMRDAVSDSPCAGAAKRVSAIEKGLVDVKAKYWALELRQGRAAKGSFAAAAAVIGTPALKKDFYSKLNRWSSKKSIPELTQPEADELAEMETQASSLARRCEILKQHR